MENFESSNFSELSDAELSQTFGGGFWEKALGVVIGVAIGILLESIDGN
ncbi:hypothetical protein SAMN05661096_01482 [Marivirga sericea]|uniref:Uncharacterized protein n=1 Tax=Marivirga sericea TaxID=1028 RepID=A0A1X7JBG0_9BACT|nr:hypothetical protein [Marivirga sericea]SMG24711.1 hypothetical protein SAMN05661096_01482 [Marivirga sericea]